MGRIWSDQNRFEQWLEVELAATESLAELGVVPEEAARLLWQAARAGEPWAIQELCRRFAPQTQSLRMIHEVEDGRLDYTKLTDEQLRQLDSILEQAGAQPISPGCREGTPESV